MVGVLLFVLSLLITGFLVSIDFFKNFFPKLEKFKSAVDNYSFLIGIIAMVIAVWNFFAPDFTAVMSPPVIGALIPSVLMFLCGVILASDVLNYILIPDEKKTSIKNLLTKYSSLIGFLTMLFGIIHLFAYSKILF